MKKDLEMIMSANGSKTVIVFAASLTFIVSSLILFSLNQMGIIAFTGSGWIVNTLNLLNKYLGASILFFAGALIGYGIFFGLLQRGLCRFPTDPGQMENIRYFNAGLEIFITLFFAIGVLFTAWGLQNALVSALGDVSKEEAARQGAWGILRQLVDNGILIAMWTTIVGGAGGYVMRISKFLFLGKALIRCSNWQRDRDRIIFFESLESIRQLLEKVQQNTSKTEIN